MIEDSYDEGQSWQLSKFSEKVGKHFTTINKWFKILEEKQLHYVNRLENSNQRVYNEVDFKVAEYIVQKTSESTAWRFEAVIAHLEDSMPYPPIQLRSFPASYNPDKDEDGDREDKGVKGLDLNVAIELLSDRLNQFMHNEWGSVLNPLQQETKMLIQAVHDIQETVNEQSVMQRSLSIIQQNIQSKIKLQALEAWESKPASEKLIKTGLFRKELDINKRDQFIEKFMLENYSKELDKELERIKSRHKALPSPDDQKHN